MLESVVNIQNSNKDILAKLMATENITVLHKKVPTAYFDIKNRTLVCPMLKHDMSDEMYDLFMGHEVGHALNTPMEGWHDSVCELGPIFKGYLNVVEDVRIEKAIKAKYPGLRRSFYQGYKELAEMDFFGIEEKGVYDLILIDKLNIHFKIGSIARVEFTDEEMVYVKRCENLKTFEEVMELAKELFEKQKAESKDKIESMTQDQLKELMDELGIEPKENSEGNTEIEVLSEEGEEGQNPESGFMPAEEESDLDVSEEESKQFFPKEGEDEKEDEGSSDGEGEAKEEELEDGEDSAGEKGEGAGKSAEEELEEQLEDELNKSETDEEFRSNEGDLHEESDKHDEPKYFELPSEIKYNNFIAPWKDIDELIEGTDLDRTKIHAYTKRFIDQNKKIVNYMVKEFEMKKAAADYKRSRSAKTGELNMDKLHLYQLKDDIFDRIQVVPDGKNHGVVMVLDWSGSMSGSVKPTVEQAALLSMFCRRIQIPFRLYAFSDAYQKKSYKEATEEYSKKRRNLKTKKARQNLDKERERFGEIDTFGKTVFEEGDKNRWHLGSLNLLEIFNEKMSNSEFIRNMENWFQLGFSTDGYRYQHNYYDKSHDNYDIKWNQPWQLCLGGTPLDHSIICMRDYIKDFKRDYNLDITTFITLTDGESHGVFNRSNAHLVDRKINKVFKLGGEYGYGRNTHRLLKWLSETTGARTIGFYLTKVQGRRFFYDAERFSGVEVSQYDDESQAKKTEFTKLATTLEGGAYDLAILINKKKIEIDYQEDELQVQIGANKGALKRALVKAGNNKMQQRVILNKFVQQMAI